MTTLRFRGLTAVSDRMNRFEASMTPVMSKDMNKNWRRRDADHILLSLALGRARGGPLPIDAVVFEIEPWLDTEYLDAYVTGLSYGAWLSGSIAGPVFAAVHGYVVYNWSYPEIRGHHRV